MRWNFHGLTIEGTWDAAPIGERWLATFDPRAPSRGDGLARLDAAPASPRPKVDTPPNLFFNLALAGEAPPSPSAAPDFQQGELLAYYIRGAQVTAHFPRFGQLQLDLARGTTQGVLTPAALTTHGVFEDLLAIGLSPHLRRRGMFLIHAFAACPPAKEEGSRKKKENHAKRSREAFILHPSSFILPAILLVGDIGAGKTTTGLALLHAGWKLLSNDSPILKMDSDLKVLAYPGLLSAYPDSLARFPELAQLNVTPESREKILFAAESVYPDVWRDAAPPAAIFFPQVEARKDHALERLSAPEALQRILPHAIEQWDREMIPAHLALLNQLIQSIPAYRLRLGPEVEKIPEMVASVL